MPKRRLKRELDTDNLSVTFTDLDNNESLRVVANDVWPGINDATANVGNNETFRHAICKMVNDTFGDTASDPGKSIPAIKARVEAVTAGTWSQRGEGSGPRQTDLAVAVFNVMMARGQTTTPDGAEVTQDVVNAAVADWSDERKKEMRSDPDVAAEIKRLRADRAAADAKAAQKAAKAKDREQPSAITL